MLYTLRFAGGLKTNRFRYGRCNSYGTCNGLIGMLQRNEINMTVSAVAMYSDRLKAVNFGPKILTDEIGYIIGPKLIKQSSKNSHAALSDFTVFNWEVFVMLALVYYCCTGYLVMKQRLKNTLQETSTDILWEAFELLTLRKRFSFNIFRVSVLFSCSVLHFAYVSDLRICCVLRNIRALLLICS